jgi:CHAT domain-containing protein/tetratricopeptide (TPR) repeat protein
MALAALLATALTTPADEPQAPSAKILELTRQSQTLLEQGRLAEAARLAEQALALDRKLHSPERYPDGDPQLIVSLLHLGEILRRKGELDRALQLCQEALTMSRKLFPAARYRNGHQAVEFGLRNVGAVLRARGDLAGAEPYYREALAEARKLYTPARFPAGHPQLGIELNNLGLLLLQSGDLAGADPLVHEAVAVRRKLYPKERFPAGHPQLAQSLNNLGLLLRARGDLARAESVYREALAMFERLYPVERLPDGHPDLGLCLNNLGHLLEVRGQTAAAEDCYRKALAMWGRLFSARRFPDGHPYLAAGLSNLGELLRGRGDLAGAEPFYRDALAMCRKLYPEERFAAGHPDLALALSNLGALLQSRGELAHAEALLREAVAISRKVYAPERYPAGHPTLAASLENLGGVLVARGELARAEPLYREALDVRQRLAEVFLSSAAEAEARDYLAQLPRTRDGYLSATRNRPPTDEAVYAAVWKTRGALARWLGQRRLALRDADPATRDLARELARTRRLLAAALLAPDPAGGRRVRALADRKEELEKDLSRRLPRLGALMRSNRHTPDDLRRRLPGDAVLIDFLRYVRFEQDPKQAGPKGERRTPCYVAFVLAPGRPLRRVELGPAVPISDACVAWRKAVADGREERAAAARVARLVWAPLQPHVPARAHSVFLVPDGILTSVAWAALPGRKPGGILLEEYALSTLPHGEFLVDALSDPVGKRPSGTLLAVGDVAYDRAGGAKLAWPSLPGTARELAGILSLAGDRPVTVRRGARASTSQLLTDLPQARWAHLATHGFFANEHVRSALRLAEKDYERGRRGERVGAGARSPLALSGLVLAGANRSTATAADAGILSAEAIAGLDLDGLELAVLSACDTGLGEVAEGEGVFGLQRAFHLAGCKNVVASLWKVDDEATAAFMGLFYHKLWQEKRPPLEALRQAQLALYHHPERIGRLARARGPDFAKEAETPGVPGSKTRAPARLWAGFVLSGAGR